MFNLQIYHWHDGFHDTTLRRCTDTTTVEWDAGLAYQTVGMLQFAISLCANHTPPTPDEACELFETGYPETRGGYPAGCDDNSFMALLESDSKTVADVEKQCNRCGPMGYYERVSEFAAPLVGRISETCRQGRPPARARTRTSPLPVLRPLEQRSAPFPGSKRRMSTLFLTLTP
jgi:hypothetical protein